MKHFWLLVLVGSLSVGSNARFYGPQQQQNFGQQIFGPQQQQIFGPQQQQTFGPQQQQIFGPQKQQIFEPQKQQNFGPRQEQNFGPRQEQNFGPRQEQNFGPQRPQTLEPGEYDRLLQLLKDNSEMRKRGSGYLKYGNLRDRMGPQEDRKWKPTVNLGDVVGVAVNHNGDPVILHRGGRVWQQFSFNESHYLQDNTKLPTNCVVILDKYSAQAKDVWGANVFLMPHGITIDPEGNIWITDVGLHQVIKFSGANYHPLIELGEAEVPGSDDKHFCQPTSTAVTSLGEVFVADGYCNNRVIKFSVDGIFLEQFGSTGPSSMMGPGSLHLPHGITLDEPMDALCVADREGRRIVCYRAGLYDPKDFGSLVSIIPELQGRRVFDVTSLGDGMLAAVCGSEAEGALGVGFTADITDSTVYNFFEPKQGLHNPHALALSPDGTSIYIAEMVPNTLWKFNLHNF